MSRYRKPRHAPGPRRVPNRLPLTAAICLAFSATAFAQDPAAQAPAAAEPPAQTTERVATLENVTVTAQKRTENLQKVPISIQVLGEEKLDEMNVTDFEGYVQLLPAVAFDSGEAGGAVPYM